MKIEMKIDLKKFEVHRGNGHELWLNPELSAQDRARILKERGIKK